MLFGELLLVVPVGGRISKPEMEQGEDVGDRVRHGDNSSQRMARIPSGVIGDHSADANHSILLPGFPSGHSVMSSSAILQGHVALWESDAAAAYFGVPLPILNILVPHTGQVPRVAGLPFFIVICSVSFIVLLCLHFMQ